MERDLGCPVLDLPLWMDDFVLDLGATGRYVVLFRVPVYPVRPLLTVVLFPLYVPRDRGV